MERHGLRGCARHLYASGNRGPAHVHLRLLLSVLLCDHGTSDGPERAHERNSCPSSVQDLCLCLVVCLDFFGSVFGFFLVICLDLLGHLIGFFLVICLDFR